MEITAGYCDTPILTEGISLSKIYTIDEKTKSRMEFYKSILNSPEAKNYHPSYIAALKLNASGFCHVCYDGPIWKEKNSITYSI